MLKKTNKIGILTLNGYHNYGNRLQNYATQEILKDLGFEAETILVDRSNIEEKKLSKRLERITSFRELKIKIFKRITNYFNKDIIKERNNKFISFTKEHIKETEYSISNRNIPKDLSGRYDYFITGSDQVWNPYNLHGTSLYFLTFTEKRKRIAFAASFGISKIPTEFHERYKKWLFEMHNISVREKSGAIIIKELINKEVVVLVDPTLMLSKEKWLSISKKPKNKPTKKYLLTYFLGDPTNETKIQIKNISEKYKLKVVKLFDLNDRETYKTGPAEFIDYINSAALVLTDSYHGVIFSILMEKPFVCYDRRNKKGSMYSRIENLLDICNLRTREEKYIKDNEEDIFNLDYSLINKILATERRKSFDYLKKSLALKET